LGEHKWAQRGKEPILISESGSGQASPGARGMLERSTVSSKENIKCKLLWLGDRRRNGRAEEVKSTEKKVGEIFVHEKKNRLAIYFW